MSGYFAARDIVPQDYFGGMMRGIESAQKQRESNFRLDAMQAQSDWQRDNMEAQQLMRAMQLGVGSPEAWDNAMTTLAEAGNKTASRYVGQWSPLRAPRMLESYRKAYGGGSGQAAQGGGQAAPVDGVAPSLSDDEVKLFEQAVASMPQAQRAEKVKHYDHMLRAMDNVTNPADLDAMLQDFVARGMMPADVAEQHRARYGSPSSMWKNFQDDFSKLRGMRDALAKYSMPNQMGIPVGGQPTYKTEWDAENSLGVITETRPGQKPTFSVERPGGIPAGVAPGGKWPEGLKDKMTEENKRAQQWSTNPRVQSALAVKNAADMLIGMDVNTNTGVSDIAAVYQFVTLLDPESVVREGEIALLNEAKSLIDRIKGSAKRVQEGRTLTPKVLSDMQDAAKRLREIAYRSYTRERKMNLESVRPYAGYIDPEAAYPDYWGADGFVPPPPPPVTTKGTGIGGTQRPPDFDDAPNPGSY